MNLRKSCFVSCFIMLVILVFISGLVYTLLKISENNPSSFQVLLGYANEEFENYKHDARISKCSFIGPEVIDFQVKNKDTIYAMFLWYNIIEKDTFWIKYQGHLQKKESDGIYLSDNMSVFIDSCKSKSKTEN